MNNATLNEYRCTRNISFCDRVSERQGYYISASSKEEALAKMADRFPEDEEGFTIDLWKGSEILASTTKPEKTIDLNRVVNALKGVALGNETRLIQARKILELFISCDISVRKGKMREDLKQWILTDSDGNKAGLYLGAGTGWALDGLKPNQELKGFFDMDFEAFLVDNDIDFE